MRRSFIPFGLRVESEEDEKASPGRCSCRGGGVVWGGDVWRRRKYHHNIFNSKTAFKIIYHILYFLLSFLFFPFILNSKQFAPTLREAYKPGHTCYFAVLCSWWYADEWNGHHKQRRASSNAEQRSESHQSQSVLSAYVHGLPEPRLGIYCEDLYSITRHHQSH